jgi:hypothetical protein
MKAKRPSSINRPVLPKTFIEPGDKGRWIFSSEAAEEIFRLLDAIHHISAGPSRRLFRVLLGGILTDISNVRISGKGRRYRSGLECNQRRAIDVRQAFINSCHDAIAELHSYRRRPELGYELLRGDSRKMLDSVKNVDLVVFSPPYPNSFDYTDVYNLELWMLGYLKTFEANRVLRQSTLCSHVQVLREFPQPPTSSTNLKRTLGKLRKNRDSLWSPHLPEMVGGYFADLEVIFQRLKKSLNKRAQIWIVVGDSKYADIRVDSAAILRDIATAHGYTSCFSEPFRSMRSSPQQGGDEELPETLLCFRLG